MAFTDDMENIVKATGLTEDELASFIITKENEGLTNEEIVDLLVSISDNKDQTEYDALQSLGLKPAGVKPASYQQAHGLFDRFAAAGESVANNLSDWRNSHPEQWRVGMVNAMFGDNSMLSQYYNSQAQNEYNQYLKEYDRANAQKEQDAAYKKEVKEAEVEMAGLNRDLIKADAPEAAVIKKRQESLIAKYPELENSNKEAVATQQQENEYQSKKIGVRSAIPTVFADDNAINTQIANVMASDLRPQDKEELVKELQSKKSTAQLAREASQSAVASHSGKKTTDSLTDSDLKQKAEDAVKNNTSPAKLSKEVKSKLFELNYSYSSGKWALKKGAK